MRPEEKFDFPLLSSWEYGWRMGKTDTPNFYLRDIVFEACSIRGCSLMGLTMCYMTSRRKLQQLILRGT